MFVPPDHGGPIPQPIPQSRLIDTKDWVLPDDRIIFSDVEMQIIEAQAAQLSALQEVEELVELWRCRKSIRYWVDTYVHIKTTSGFEKWLPYKWQYRMLLSLEAGQSIIVLKSRQVGASWVGAAYALWRCLFLPDQACYFFSVSEDKAEDQMSRVKDYLSHLPAWMTAQVDQLSLVIKFHGSRSKMFSKPAGKNAARGISANFVMCDEMGFWDHDEMMWAGIYPTLSTGGQAFIVSTPPEPERGERVYIQRLEAINQGIATHNPDYDHWESIKIHYSECRGRDENWVKRQKTGVNERTWRREYELAMGEVGFPFFAIDKIKYEPQRLQEPTTSPFFQGYDTSELKKGRDLSSIQVLDERGVQVDCWHSTVKDGIAGILEPISLGEWTGDMQLPPGEDGGMVGAYLTKYPGVAFVEKNAQGVMTLAAAQRYQDQDHIVHGWTTGQTSRNLALNELALDLENEEVIITDEFTHKCLINFVQTESGKAVAATGYKDDPVIALALANQARRQGRGMTFSTTVSVGGGNRLMSQDTQSDSRTINGVIIGAPMLGGEDRWTSTL